MNHELAAVGISNLWGWGNKTASFKYLGHSLLLLGGELDKQDLYLSKGGPLDQSVFG